MGQRGNYLCQMMTGNHNTEIGMVTTFMTLLGAGSTGRLKVVGNQGDQGLQNLAQGSMRLPARMAVLCSLSFRGE